MTAVAARGATGSAASGTITPKTAAASREVDGTTYHFCSAHCAASFDADPQRYTAASAHK